MNSQQRKLVEKLIHKLEEARDQIEEICNDEQEKFDNMPEGLQQTERAQKIEEGISSLESAHGDLESVISSLEGIINN